jgi:hypothetical protein
MKAWGYSENGECFYELIGPRIMIFINSGTAKLSCRTVGVRVHCCQKQTLPQKLVKTSAANSPPGSEALRPAILNMIQHLINDFTCKHDAR